MARRKKSRYTAYNTYGFAPYTTVAQKKRQAEDMEQQLREKDPEIEPVLIEGRTIAKSWWGKSWNKNIERYADYAYRLSRGRSYLRCGCVLDLKIKQGCIESTVAGSSQYNYTIRINIAPLNSADMKRIIEQTNDQLSSLNDLLAGNFPKSLQELFFRQDHGLFPTPNDITFNCDCPDWANMCKHVAATLYGVGARLDKDPSLFFTLRSIDQTALISEAIASQTDELLTRASSGRTSGRRRRIAATDAADVFGVAMQAPAEKVTPAKKKTGRKTATKKSAAKKTTAKKAAAKKTTKKR